MGSITFILFKCGSEILLLMQLSEKGLIHYEFEKRKRRVLSQSTVCQGAYRLDLRLYQLELSKYETALIKVPRDPCDIGSK